MGWCSSVSLAFIVESYDGLLVKTTTQRNVSLSLYLRLYGVKKIKIKNLADLVPACRVVFTLL